MQRHLAVFLVLGLGYGITALFLMPVHLVPACWEAGFCPALFGATAYLLLEMRRRYPILELGRLPLGWPLSPWLSRRVLALRDK